MVKCSFKKFVRDGESVLVGTHDLHVVPSTNDDVEINGETYLVTGRTWNVTEPTSVTIFVDQYLPPGEYRG